MDLTRLEYFLTVARTQNLTRAAELHRISPAAISKAMRLLQTEVSRELLQSSPQGITLTREGQRFLKSLEPKLRDLKHLLETDENPEGSKPPLRIATFEVFSTYFIENYLIEKKEETSLELHELTPGLIEKAVEDGSCDLGITYLPVPHPALDFLNVGLARSGVYTGVNAPFREVRPRETPFAIPLSPIGSTPSRVRGLDGWPEAAFPRNIAYRVTLMESALGLARSGKACVYIPEFIARLHNGRASRHTQLVECTIPKHRPGAFPPAQVCIVKRRDTRENTQVRQLARALRLTLSPGA